MIITSKLSKKLGKTNRKNQHGKTDETTPFYQSSYDCRRDGWYRRIFGLESEHDTLVVCHCIYCQCGCTGDFDLFGALDDYAKCDTQFV